MMQGHTHLVWAVGISPDGTRASSGGPDETLRLWDTQQGACLAVLRASGPYDGMNISSVTGISQVQKTTLIRLGAVDMS
jgi:WD40 repeat protein